MKKLGLAVVGCGRIAQQHMEALAQCADEVAFVAAIDPDKARADECVVRFGAEKAYYSIDEALEDSRIEAVLLALPHYLHHDACVQCARAGRHVLVEKVMSLSYADSLDMVREADENGVTLMVGQSMRHSPGAREAKRLVESGELGDLFNITESYRSCIKKPATAWWTRKDLVGEGFIIQLQACHSIDLFTYIMGGRMPVRVYAQWDRKKDYWEGADDLIMAYTYADNATVSSHMTYNAAQDSCDCLRIYNGTKGTFISGMWGRLNTFRGETKLAPENSIEFLAAQMHEFASAVREERESIASGREVAPVNALIDAVILSAKLNQLVDMRRLHPELKYE